MTNLVENQIQKYIAGKPIKERKVLSEAFNIRCEKITINKAEVFIAKYYYIKNDKFNSIVSETDSLIYLLKKFPKLFPEIKYKSKNLLIINFIENNNIKYSNYQKKLADEILKIHSINSNQSGFKFDAQIGGLRQNNFFEYNWTNFFRHKRLNMIFEIINKTNPMPNLINKKIEKVLKNLENYLPSNPKITLLHGDLWPGNILYHNGNVAAFIDPGIYFGHNELEIAYLSWFKFIDKKFLDYYSQTIKINEDYYKYEPIYQLYFSLLNIHLWSREYIKDTDSLLKKII